MNPAPEIPFQGQSPSPQYLQQLQQQQEWLARQQDIGTHQYRLMQSMALQQQQQYATFQPMQQQPYPYYAANRNQDFPSQLPPQYSGGVSGGELRHGAMPYQYPPHFVQPPLHRTPQQSTLQVPVASPQQPTTGHGYGTTQPIRMELEPVVQPAPRQIGLADPSVGVEGIDVKVLLGPVGQRREGGAVSSALPYSVTNNDGLSPGGSSGTSGKPVAGTCCVPPAGDHSASSRGTAATNVSAVTTVGANATNSNTTGTPNSAAAEDQLCFLRTVESFRQYLTRADTVLQHRRSQFASLSAEHKQLLGFDADARIFGPYAIGIHENQQFLLGVCRSAKTLFSGYWPNVPVPAYFDHPDFAPRGEEDEDDGDENPPTKQMTNTTISTSLMTESRENSSPTGTGTGTGTGSAPASAIQDRYRKQAAERQQSQTMPPATNPASATPNHTTNTAAATPTHGAHRTTAHSASSGGTLYHSDDVTPSTIDSEKVFSTLRQCVRDWSERGSAERSAVYGPILRTLTHYYPTLEQRQQVNILVPGAGLSRLSVELAMLGFNACGNEFSYHMLIAGHYLMNHMRYSNQYTIYPYVDTTLNLVRRSDQFSAAMIPDLCTTERASEIHQGGLSMVAGDFLEVYNRPSEYEQWDVVASCFFLDTAHNVLDYLTCIYKILNHGGLLINLGPLLYHFADSTAETSIELSLDELLHAASQIGFVPVTNIQLLPTTYTNNTLSMKQMVYQSAFFALQKPYQNLLQTQHTLSESNKK